MWVYGSFGTFSIKFPFDWCICPYMEEKCRSDHLIWSQFDHILLYCMQFFISHRNYNLPDDILMSLFEGFHIDTWIQKLRSANKRTMADDASLKILKKNPKFILKITFRAVSMPLFTIKNRYLINIINYCRY